MEYASNAKGNLGVTLGTIGTVLGALSSGAGVLSGVTGVTATTSNYVTKDEMNMIQELASKDSQIALLTAESNTEEKMIEVYKQSHSELVTLRDTFNSTIKEMQTEINANRREQDSWNANQSVVNAQISAAIATNTNSISALQTTLSSITQVKVPNAAVCPGWGNTVTTPVTTNTTLG